MQNVIFLDFDGTMIPTTFSKYMEQISTMNKTSEHKDLFGEFFAPHCIENLRELINKTGALIVFSSNWKDEGFENLYKMWIKRYNFGVPIGCTPTIKSKQFLRGDEIEAWISANECGKYVILDDMGSFQFHTHQIPNLVNCDERFGFTKKELKKAIEILK